MDEKRLNAITFFFEVGIINQLSTKILADALDEGLHPSQFGVLRHLIMRGDGHTPLQIAQAFQVPKTSMTNSLKVLEAKGFIEVRANAEDGRSKLVFLTDKGRSQVAQVFERLGSKFEAMSEFLDFELMETLRPQLQQIRMQLDDNRG